MSRQRDDKAVARDAQRFNETYRGLKRFLWRKGIRSLHSSKAREAIARASTARSGEGTR